MGTDQWQFCLIQLNDCLLYTSYLSSPSPSCGLKLHHELPLSRMRSFTLAASSMQVRNEWMSVLSEAIAELQSKQQTFPTRMLTESSEFRLRLGQQVIYQF